MGELLDVLTSKQHLQLDVNAASAHSRFDIVLFQDFLVSQVVIPLFPHTS